MSRLFTPIKIRDLEIRNRIVMTAMHLNYTPEGKVTPQLVGFYEERARGGAGLLMVGGCIIDDWSGPGWMVDLRDDSLIEGHAGLVQAVKAHGARVGCQLYQAGRYAHSFSIGGREALAPSAVYTRFTRETPKEMTSDDIAMVIGNFAAAARRAKDAGYDLVEILASAGYLISQFLSPVTNQRSDSYGGELGNRMRFGLEVADAVRAAVGPDFPVSCRVAGSDYVEGSHTNRESALFAAELERHGVDAINVTGGWHESRVPQLTMAVPRAGLAYLAAGIKDNVSIPVIGCNRINDVFVAEEMLRDGMADMIGMARAIIADPSMPLKAQEGRFDEIIHCIGCNQGCFDHVFYLQAVTCTVNPRAGHELEPAPGAAERRKKIAVVGGGAAGMKAAATAAARGHKVSLFERDAFLGGQLNLASAPPGREEFDTAAEDLENQLLACDVDVFTEAEVTAGELAAQGFDAVIVATGAEPLVPPIPGLDLPHVVGAWDVLAGDAAVPGKNVVVVGGGAVGSETALFISEIGSISGDTLKFLMLNKGESVDSLQRLAAHGSKNVTVVEMLDKVCADVGISTRWTLLQDMEHAGISSIPNAVAKRIEPGRVVVEVAGEERVLPAETVVVACGSRPVGQDLYDELVKAGIESYLIGDAKQARKALDAIAEGVEIGGQI
ncbi:MAG: oxidoreductase [Candidatus Geothermincolia bacterium]